MPSPASKRLAATGLALIALVLTQAGSAAAQPASAGQVFMKPSPLYLQAPQFDRISDADFQPALEAGMAEELAQMQRIAADRAAPTFENTIVAMERAGQMLKRTNRVFSALTQANTDPTLQAVQKAESPRMAAHHDAIYLDPKLFARVQAVWLKRDQLTGPEARQLTSVVYDEFVRSGAKLSGPEQAQLRQVNQELSSLSTAFSQKLLAATKAGALTQTDKAALAGLSDQQLAAAAQDAHARGLDGQWLVPLQNTTPAARAAVAGASRHPQGPIRAQLDPRRARRRERHPLHPLRDRAAARGEGAPARLSGLRGLCAGEPDGQDAGRRGRLPWPARRPHPRQGGDRSRRYPGDDRQGR